jgi:AraC family transcriptional regulator, regulatory protein of adaptative response / DNA-3-methyladenine glycosylase II
LPRPTALHLPPDLDLDWILDFLAMRAVPGVEEVGPGEYRRSFRASGVPAVLGVRVEGDSTLAVEAAGIAPAEAARWVARMLDLEAPVGEFLELARADPRLGAVVARRPGLRLPVFPDPFEGVVRAILGQQVSVAGARTLAGRMVERFGEDAPSLDGRPFRLFPRAETLAGLAVADLRAVGLTTARASTLLEVARAVGEGRLDLGGPALAALEALLALPGIGPWTAGYVGMRSLGDRDSYPPYDLGLIKALTALDPRGRKPGRREMDSIFEAWRPWRGYATLHLWGSL